MQVPVVVCENENCEKVIHKGDEVWHKGSELYCSGKCLIESFAPQKQMILREKHIVGGVR
ncbi:hypothetical protein H9650_11490 [Psychrobacillus sp. Sa2BUA9]|uniref:Uncharacterized protein n=1 Tax=Psychrobacillus faecigallinarum TaxID=2762235 RepID=A0ABR8RAC5_9BACI|nr:hypothetical protein [Psychrobacillus faecigallinarum]MBD7944739.1 hypothetical protein [Psychrobacillus faecigallinarum]